MLFKKYMDCHSHSSFSPDSETSMDTMIKRAIELGVSVYAVTDHCECNGYQDEYDYKTNVRASVEAMEIAKDTYKNAGIKLLSGIELGQSLQNLEAAEEALTLNPDFVLGSLHNVDGIEDFYYIDYTKLTMDEIAGLVERYYDEVLKMCEWNKFDSLGHITYPIRYIVGDHNVPLNIRLFDDVIAEIFNTIIKNQKAIEINTSGLRQKIGKLLPDEYYVKMYHDLGGKYLTIGSDSHSDADLMKGIKEGFSMAYKAGFRNMTYFEKREPKFLVME